MTEVRWNGKEFVTLEVPAGERFVTVPLGEVVFYIRKGKCIPVGKGGMNTMGIDLSDVTLLGGGKEYTQYLDDGFTRDCSAQNLRVLSK